MRAKAGKKRISTTVPEAEVEGFRAELGVVRSHRYVCAGGRLFVTRVCDVCGNVSEWRLGVGQRESRV